MTASLIPSLLAFIAVLAMIPLALWLMKRAQGLRAGATGPLSLVAGLSLGPRERIVVVHAAGRYLVVGVTGQTMSLLANLDAWPGHVGPAGTASASADAPRPEGAADAASPAAAPAGAATQGFAGLLRSLQSRSQGPDKG